MNIYLMFAPSLLIIRRDYWNFLPSPYNWNIRIFLDIFGVGQRRYMKLSNTKNLNIDMTCKTFYILGIHLNIVNKHKNWILTVWPFHNKIQIYWLVNLLRQSQQPPLFSRRFPLKVIIWKFTPWRNFVCLENMGTLPDVWSTHVCQWLLHIIV